MLRQGMDTDNNMRTPAFEKFPHITDATGMKELSRFGANSIHHPVKILHPVLLVAQHPVVEVHQPGGQVGRLLDSPDYPDSVRLALKKFLHTVNNRGSSRAMAAASIT
jgi:hypothetical protein